MRSDAPTLEREGRVWARGALGEASLALFERTARVKKSPGLRLDRNDDLSEVIGESSGLTQLARKFLPGAFPVRVLVFNKSSDVNWGVPWHQDRVIAVREKHRVGGFRTWTKKAGIWHVEPPIDILKEMVFARVHLDDTDERNGCLELALGTHTHGRVSAETASDVAQSAPIEVCRARRGDVLVVKALTLHRSRPSQQDSDRRTLRIDYSAKRLPEPLQWAY